MNHDQVQELLPWLANDSLSANDQAALENHAHQCDACVADLELLRALRSVSRTPQPTEPAYRPELLDGVMARLATTPQHAAPVATPKRKRRTLARRFRDWASARIAWAATPLLMRSALVAQGALIAVLAGVLLVGGTGNDSAEQAYETVSGSTQGDVAIAFRPDATEAEIRAVLVAADATVVAGPSAVGIYRLTLNRDAALRATMVELSASDLVIYLEPVVQP